MDFGAAIFLAVLTVPAGQRPAEEVLRRDGPVRHPRGGRGGHHEAASSHRGSVNPFSVMARRA